MGFTKRVLAVLACTTVFACASNTRSPQPATVRTPPPEIEILTSAPGSNYVFVSDLRVTSVVSVSGGPRQDCEVRLSREAAKVFASAVLVLQASTSGTQGTVTCEGTAYARKK